ncbi:MAG: DUF4388 domain-containing protein [Chloroflexales bacterium]|nr:DUF4388 domain-containing protein [Chloroflexales bacterium]
MKLEGALDTFPLRELIEMTVYSSVTGVLTIYGASAVGRVFFRDGRPYHASYGDERGEQAVVRLFEERQGSFSFVADTVSDEATLWYDPLDLIELCEQQARRWAQVRPAIPDMRLVPELLNVPEGNHVTLDTEHWPVFSAIDGARSVGEIVALLNTNALEVCEALASLQRAGLLKLAAATLSTRQNAEGQEVARTHTSLFDRLLATMPVPPSAPSSAPSQPAAATAPDEDPILRMLRG